MGMIACGVYLNEALQKPNSVAEFELRINGFTPIAFSLLPLWTCVSALGPRRPDEMICHGITSQVYLLGVR
jgi:hypothetical protein